MNNKMSREERIEVILKGQNAEKTILSYDREDNRSPAYAQNIQPKGNTYEIILHCFSNSIIQKVIKDQRSKIDAYTMSEI